MLTDKITINNNYFLLRGCYELSSLDSQQQHWSNKQIYRPQPKVQLCKQVP